MLITEIRLLQSEVGRAKNHHQGELMVQRDLYLDLLDTKIEVVIKTLEMITASVPERSGKSGTLDADQA